MRDNRDVEEFLNEGQDREDIPAQEEEYYYEDQKASEEEAWI